MNPVYQNAKPIKFPLLPTKKIPTLLSITLTTLTNAFQQILKINLLFPHTSNEIKFVLFWRKKKAFNFNRILQKGHQFSLFLISSIHIPQNKRKCTTVWGEKKTHLLARLGSTVHNSANLSGSIAFLASIDSKTDDDDVVPSMELLYR